jgi:DNA primase
LLVEEEFNVKIVTLDAGFDPDLYIRRKGKDAYGSAIKHSQKYFDYLIDRARVQFPPRNAESKIKAVNHLLPHIQRVPNRIVRDGLALEIAQKLGIDSKQLRQELKNVATNRSATEVKTTVDMQITGAERVLIRALASATEIQAGDTRTSARDGTDEEFDPARQAQYALQSEHLYEGLAAQSLIEALLDAGAEAGGATGVSPVLPAASAASRPGGDARRSTSDVMALPKTEEDRRLLASVLMHEEEDLTPETVEGAVRALRRIYLRRRQEEVQRAFQRPGISMDEKRALLQENLRLKRALMDPGLADAAGQAS